jgi:MFS family permease
MSRGSARSIGLSRIVLTRTSGMPMISELTIAYGITFLGAGVMAPVWSRFADLYGRKLILIQACLPWPLACR